MLQEISKKISGKNQGFSKQFAEIIWEFLQEIDRISYKGFSNKIDRIPEWFLQQKG